ncbi:hexokinase-domain-containing protein [Lophiotrema nucula]|uniref:Phosphotransferase n=1 Tax=Lophiotrema nucula TaxID=690887 RepID=A0A6A5ZSL1_9PLEO|nr:hexokinase-domain-containing protein [Lophiotrema nucula]
MFNLRPVTVFTSLRPFPNLFVFYFLIINTHKSTITMPTSLDLVGKESWRQRSELEKMADLPPELEKELDRLDNEFWVSRDKLKEIVKRFQEELEDGLRKHGQNISMNLSWVLSMPTGDEKGTFLALDLGGTNLRVCIVELHGKEGKEGKRHTLTQEQYKLDPKIKESTTEDLWNHVADTLQTFLSSKGLDKQYTPDSPMPLAFTFSYPALQDRIDHGKLVTWTKGFDISGVEGHDVAAQLRAKIEDRGLPIDLVCLANDTVGAMIASAYNDPATIIGAIFGTGCNAAYMEELSKSSIPKARLSDDDWKLAEKEALKMAINCEYGAFDNERRVLPVTKYDEQIDRESPRPGEQGFEKLSAGLYLGEIFRLILVDLVDRNLVFKDQDVSQLQKPYTLDTGFLSEIEDDETPRFEKTRALFKEKLGLEPRDEEIELSRRLAELIAVRGARLCACGIAAICLNSSLESGHVAADGSVANKHPKFKKRWAKALGEVLDWEDREKASHAQDNEGPIKLTSAEDGSGVGVAVIAAMTVERRERGNFIGLRR